MAKLTRAHLGIAVLPSFFLGSLFALILGYEFNFPVFIVGFIIIFLLYAAASYANDYYDFDADKFNRQFGFSGGSGVLQKYPELKNITKWCAIGMLLLSIIMTALLAWKTYIPYWTTAYIGIGLFFTWFYSAPPIKLVYRGLSEIPHFIAGVINAGWGYILITGRLHASVLLFSIPLAIYLLNIILIFEIPDLEADIHGQKTNFIVKHGRRNGFLLVSILSWSATVYFFILASIGWLDGKVDFLLISIISLVPGLLSLFVYLKNSLEKNQAIRYAIKTAFTVFGFSVFLLIYFIFLLAKYT
jgi:1,4-dihydroxy-2-naphthoate octaprenyltransferase